jgi:hypothetical protein
MRFTWQSIDNVRWFSFDDPPKNEEEILILFKGEDIWTGIYFDYMKDGIRRNYIIPKENGCKGACEKPEIPIRGDMKWMPFGDLIVDFGE